jgi:hypothetical protein
MKKKLVKKLISHSASERTDPEGRRCPCGVDGAQ